MGVAPRWTRALTGLWAMLMLGLGLVCLLSPQTLLSVEGYRTLMRGVAATFGMLAIALGVMSLLAMRSGRIDALQTILAVVGLWSLLLPTVMMTNLGAVEPIRSQTGLNVILLAGMAQCVFGLPALLGAVQLGRMSREGTS